MIQTLLNSLSGRVRRDLARHVRNHNYAFDDADLIIDKIRWRGLAEIITPDGLVIPGKNLITTEGKNHMLNVVLNQGTQVATWYLAPFSGNVTPAETWTAANFASNATELTTQYSESTRIEYVEIAASGGSTNNNASPGVVTAATDNVTIWGFGVLSVSTKASTAGTLLAAIKYSTSKVLASTGDQAALKYTPSISNA